MSCCKIGEDKSNPFAIQEVGDCGEVKAGRDHKRSILGLISIEGFWFINLDFIMMSQHGFLCDGYWLGKWCCKGNGWWRGILTSSCDGGGLVDQKVLFCGEVDSGVFDGVVIEFCSVKDMSFWDNFPNVYSMLQMSVASN